MADGAMVPRFSAGDFSAASALLDIISNPERTKQHLDAIAAERATAETAAATAVAAAKTAAEAKKDAEAKLAEAVRLGNGNEARAKNLDQRQETLVAKDKRLADFEASVSAHEKEVMTTLATREGAIRAREADVTKREAALRILEEEVQTLKETLQRKADAIREVREALK